MPNIKLYNGDCLEVMDQLIKDGIKVDAVITDLPYNLTSNKWDKLIPFDKMWEKIFSLCKDTAVQCFTCSQPFTSKLLLSNIDNFRHEWIWKKTGVAILLIQ